MESSLLQLTNGYSLIVDELPQYSADIHTRVKRLMVRTPVVILILNGKTAEFNTPTDLVEYCAAMGISSTHLKSGVAKARNGEIVINGSTV